MAAADIAPVVPRRCVERCCVDQHESTFGSLRRNLPSVSVIAPRITVRSRASLSSDERDFNHAARREYRLCRSEKACEKLPVKADSAFAGYMRKHETYSIPASAFERRVEHCGVDAVQKLHAGSAIQLTNIVGPAPLIFDVLGWLERRRRDGNPVIQLFTCTYINARAKLKSPSPQSRIDRG